MNNKTDFVTVWRFKEGDKFNPAICSTWEGDELTIDFGDGWVKQVKYKHQSEPHVYYHDGDYEVRISSNLTSFSQSKNAVSSGTSPENLIDIKQWGMAKWGKDVRADTHCMRDMFLGCTNVNMSATDAPDLSRIEATTSMFALCEKFNGKINHWDVTNINAVGRMLFGTPEFRQDLSRWVALSNKPSPGPTSWYNQQIFGDEKTIDDYMKFYGAKNEK